eukprot:UN01340
MNGIFNNDILKYYTMLSFDVLKKMFERRACNREEATSNDEKFLQKVVENSKLSSKEKEVLMEITPSNSSTSSEEKEFHGNHTES